MIDGFDIKEYYLHGLDQSLSNFNKEILKFSEKEQEEYKLLFKHFEDTNGSPTTSTTDKGKALEDIVTFIFEKSVIFEIHKNVRTSSNEIDLLIRLNKRGQFLKAQGLVDFRNNLLSECKNYNKTIGVTWVGKFFSLLVSTENELGIIFSYKGLTGSSWNNATGLTKKFFLKTKHIILDFNIYDFALLNENHSLIDILNNKIFQLQNDTNISLEVSEHPAQLLFKKKDYI